MGSYSMSSAYIRFDEGVPVVEIGTRNAKGALVPVVLMPREAAVAAAVEILSNVRPGIALGALKKIIPAQWPGSVWGKQLGV